MPSVGNSVVHIPLALHSHEHRTRCGLPVQTVNCEHNRLLDSRWTTNLSWVGWCVTMPMGRTVHACNKVLRKRC